MRSLAIVAISASLGACSFFDELSLNAAPRLDPNKIYLGTAFVRSVSPRETHRYACLKGPVVCEQSGVGFDCRCP